MKNKDLLKYILIVIVVAALVFFILGFLRKGPGPKEDRMVKYTSEYISLL